jgi:hypothetical protein
LPPHLPGPRQFARFKRLKSFENKAARWNAVARYLSGRQYDRHLFDMMLGTTYLLSQ